MDNATRRELLNKAKSVGYTGNILDVFSAHEQGRDLIGEFMQSQQPQMAITPEEQQQGLRPAHAAGNINQSMAFPNIQPNQSFSTEGMKVPINIDKVDNQGNLVESYKSIPPGIANFPTGPYEGTVIESPARMQTGGFDYQGYYDRANKYLSRPIFTGSTLTATDIADAAQEFYKTNNYEYPLDLLLTQGQLETKLGKTLKSKHNYFNVGNTDSGATKEFPSAKDSVRNYMDLMYNDYLAKGKKSPEELLKPQGFVNYNGSRYASAPNYEAALDTQRKYINTYIAKRETGGPNIGGMPMPTLPQEEPVEQPGQEPPMQEPQVQQHMQTSPMGMGSHLPPFMQKGQSGELYYDASSQIETAQPEDTTVKQYFIGGLRNRVRYNKAKYKR
jgi:hypothetical protein